MYSLSQNAGLKIDNYVLLTTPNKFLDRIDTVAEEVGIANKVKSKLINRLEKELKLDLASISVASLSQNVSVKNALIIHDENDKVLSLKESIAVNQAWDASELETITGTGHFKILKSEAVHNRIISFLEA
jgi:alpha/beta superfamily hydrolase